MNPGEPPAAPPAMPADGQAASIPVSGTQIADFVVQRPLGAGGSFLLATSPDRLRTGPHDAGEQVVLKVFPADASGDEPTAFETLSAALQSIAAVRSPYLVQLIEAGRNAGLVYCAMEYVDGGSLAAPERQLTFAEVLEAVANAARGAHAMHEAGIPHRNIHPSGIILGSAGTKLSDPGLASYLNPGMTLTGRLGVPKVDFISPEIIRGMPASRATDLWSLGATLHYVASGDSLFPQLDQSNPVAALSAVLHTPPQISPGLPAPIEQIVRACLFTDAPDRPSTAGDLADRLDALWKR
ncbi:protein kinase [Epidermidibacterium keratini]|uniref:non-specific serine/threonine protein kinase n=1 Tax=Epidermidibacterium keratini TaxID=1891644 RepID=A0A7L4YS20_9ACTN|nr:serine/threonine-protein kinase [Epidermidibacterium keratini]QHC01753.1 protein kinase [Epidermidibacterium keratini]